MEVIKVCTKCEMEKSLTEFHKDKSKKSGYRPRCKMCRNITTKERTNNYSQIENKEKDKKVCYCCKKVKNILEYTKNISHKDGLASECKVCAYKYRNEYFKARKLYDPEFKLLTNLRSRLSEALRGNSKSQTTKQLIGLDFEIFTKWIKFQFTEGMSMDNYGSAWCHDHVLPISSFNLLDEEERQKAMNWINIRPLSPLKNIQKSNKIDRWLNVMQEVKADYFIKHLDEI